MDRALTGAPTDRSAHAVGLHEWFARRAGRVPTQPALSCDAVCWTYGELQQRVEAMSAVLAAGGVAAGDRVGYLGLNDPMFVVVMFATSRLGGVFVPLNFRLSGPELAYVIGDAGIHTLVAGEEHLAVIDGVRGTLACQRFIHRAGGAPGWEPADALMAQAATPPDAVPATADAVAVIMYTSGTTGHPKGAMLTHGNFWANNLNEMLLWDMVSTDVTLNFAPMFHVGGLLCGSLSTLLVVDIDLVGSFHVLRQAHAHLRKPGASVISITAPQSFVPMRYQAHACAAKAGVDQLTRVLALEWGGEGVRINSISPGPIDGTEGFRKLMAPSAAERASAQDAVPLKRFGSLDDIANLALFLASPYAGYISGAVIPCDGGGAVESVKPALEAAGASL